MTFGQMFHHQKIGQMMPDQTIFGHMTFGKWTLNKAWSVDTRSNDFGHMPLC